MSKANEEMRELGLTTRKVSSSVKRKLVMENAMIAKKRAATDTEARWNYFECAHGKESCDGKGGSLSVRLQRQENVNIKASTDFCF